MIYPATDQYINLAHNAIENGMTKYTAGSGIPELKKAIIHKFQRDNSLDYNANNIIVSCGGKHTLYNACQVLMMHLTLRLKSI